MLDYMNKQHLLTFSHQQSGDCSSEEELQLSLSAVIKSGPPLQRSVDILSLLELFVLMAKVWVCLLLVSVSVCDVTSANMFLTHSGILRRKKKVMQKYNPCTSCSHIMICVCFQGAAAYPENEDQQQRLREAAEGLRVATNAAAQSAIKKKLINRLEVSDGSKHNFCSTD